MLIAAILGLFAMVTAALALYMFGELWNLAQDPRFSAWKVGFILQKLFPFKVRTVCSGQQLFRFSPTYSFSQWRRVIAVGRGHRNSCLYQSFSCNSFHASSSKRFPMSLPFVLQRTFDVNLTHILLFTLAILFLSLKSV